MSETHDVRALAIIPKSITECTQLAEILAKSELLPKALRGKVPDVLMMILAGQEMGLSPMASLRNVHVIEGKPVMSADGMVALVMGSGKAVYFDRIAESESSVTYETLRIGSKTPRRCTWTIAMAKAAALDKKDNWRGYPRAMLSARAKSELARDVYPDVLAGCYTEDEIGDFDRPGRDPDAIDAEIVTSEEATLAAIDSAETIEALKAAGEQIKNWPEEAKADARKRYTARWEYLTKIAESSKSEPQPEASAS